MFRTRVSTGSVKIIMLDHLRVSNAVNATILTQQFKTLGNLVYMTF
jgi:hypothetical protein